MPNKLLAPTIRSRLIVLVCACVLPVWAFAAVLVVNYARQERAGLESDVQETTRNLRVAVDRELTGIRATLVALATSPHLQSGDFAAFHAQISQLAGADINMLLSDLERNQLLNTRRPYGEVLPQRAEAESTPRMVATGEPQVSDVVFANLAKRPVTTVDVPVRRDGKIVYVLSATIEAGHWQKLLAQFTPTEWISAVLDRRGTFIARSRLPEQFVGRQAAPELVAESRRAPEGTVRNRSVESILVQNMFSRSQLAGWTVAVAVPTALLDAPLQRSLLVVIGGGLGSVLISVLFARIAGKRISGPISSLRSTAAALGEGSVPPQPEYGVREVDEVARALERAASLLSERAAQRDRAETALRGLNDTLEHRVEARTAELESAQRALRTSYDTLEQRVAIRTADLREANEEIQRFAYIVSHDLRAPLVNIMGFTSELDTARLDLVRYLAATEAAAPADLGRAARLSVDEDMPEALGFIRTSTAKMDRLINAILKLSREGRRVLTPEPVEMDMLFAGIVDSLRQQIDARGAAVEIEHLPEVIGDRLAMEQVFSNLMDNAVKYLHPQRPGQIVVRGRRRGSRVTIEIVDNGRGIDAGDRERVFELFRRAGTQDQPGEGIGLTHVRALVRRLGGTIHMESWPGRGSTFRVDLPAELTLQTESAA